MLQRVNDLLVEQPQLLRKALDKQVQQHCKLAIELYDSKQITKLVELLDSVAPMASVLLNIRICLASPNLMDQGNTLSMTLLPYVELCLDFSPLKDDWHFVLNQVLQSLTLHIQDTKMDVGPGFMAFGLKVNPRLLAGLPPTEANLTALTNAL